MKRNRAGQTNQKKSMCLGQTELDGGQVQKKYRCGPRPIPDTWRGSGPKARSESAWVYTWLLKRPEPKERSDVGVGLSLSFEEAWAISKKFKDAWVQCKTWRGPAPMPDPWRQPGPKERSERCPCLFLNIEEAWAKSKEWCGPRPIPDPWRGLDHN